MNDIRKRFGEQLLEAEQVTPSLKERYDMQMQAMFEKPVRGARKLAWIGSTAMGIGFLILFGTMAILVPPEFPVLGRIGFALGALFGLIWAIFGVRILQKGVIDLRFHPRAAAGMGWAFTVILVILAMLLAGRHPDSIVGVQMILIGLVFLVMAAVFMIFARIEQSELRTREKLLEIELRLAELSEAKEAERESP